MAATPVHKSLESARPEPPPQATLLGMLGGRWLSHAIGVAAELGIADLLADGPKAAEELAARTDTNADALYRLLRALASYGIFTEDRCESGRGRFRLTPLAEPLRSGLPGSLRGAAIMMGAAKFETHPWTNLRYTVDTGESAFLHVFGMGPFEYFLHHPEAGKTFDDAMTGMTAMSASAIAAACDFAEGTVVDVGGGNGILLATILGAHPNLLGVLFDSPHVAEAAAATFQEAGVADRAKIAGGDFLISVPEAGDVYLLKHIVHGLSDESTVDLLRKCRGAMRPKGRVIVVEHLLVAGNAWEQGKMLDLEMLVMTSGGRERTENDFRKLFEAAGLRLARVIHPAAPIAMVEGVAA